MIDYELIARELDGIKDTFNTHLKRVLLENGLSEKLAFDDKFIEKLNEHVFNCEHCGLWIGIDNGYYYSSEGEQICEDCKGIEEQEDE